MAESAGGVIDKLPASGSMAECPVSPEKKTLEPIAVEPQNVQTIFKNNADRFARWFNPKLRFARDEVGSLLPLDQSVSFKLTARVKIPPLYSRGAIYAQVVRFELTCVTCHMSHLRRRPWTASGTGSGGTSRSSASRARSSAFGAVAPSTTSGGSAASTATSS